MHFEGGSSTEPQAGARALRRVRRALLVAASAAALWPVAGPAAAQAFPNRPLRLIVPTAPGGGTDALGRALADALGATLQQPVVVDNKAGGNAVIGTEAVVRTPPDGHSLLLVVNTHTINPAVVRKLPYDTLKDFTPIAALARSPFVVVSSAVTGVKNLKGLAELAKAEPGRIMFGSGEYGMRLTAARIGRELGITVTNVSYKGTGPMVSDMAGGHLNFSVTSIASTLPFRNSGKLHYIGVTSTERSSVLPEVETLAEQGLKGFEATVWYGLVGPANMPPELVRQINAAVRTAMSNEEVKKKLATLAMESWHLSPDEFAGFLARDLALNVNAARAAGIEPE